MLKIIVKSLLSAGVIILFGVIGLAAADVRPFDVPGELGRLQETVGGGSSSADDGSYSIPVPPYTEQVVKNRTKKGVYVGYKSKLSVGGLRKFYRIKLARSGWQKNAILESLRRKIQPGGQLLSFRKGARRCIIYFRPGSGFTTKITVLHMDAGSFAPAKNRSN